MIATPPSCSHCWRWSCTGCPGWSASSSAVLGWWGTLSLSCCWLGGNIILLSSLPPTQFYPQTSPQCVLLPLYFPPHQRPLPPCHRPARGASKDGIPDTMGQGWVNHPAQHVPHLPLLHHLHHPVHDCGEVPSNLHPHRIQGQAGQVRVQAGVHCVQHVCSPPVFSPQYSSGEYSTDDRIYILNIIIIKTISATNFGSGLESSQMYLTFLMVFQVK